ncbi:hypothetical protein IFM89_032679 [Coptis chinensis]|uniref:F-box domain-containing protein n=1 Tax=Coptis chinensis TaxID=261450 RepID=A0A835IGQ7_9MAGN|nr:hypothetical protein IFM89_032679 [Coptis chinensis]
MKEKSETSNWLDLPRDVMIIILSKLHTIDILYSVQRVCSSWRKLCKEPQFFCRIVIPSRWEDCARLGADGLAELVKVAMDRSCGELVEFSLETRKQVVLIDLLFNVVERSNTLKYLRLDTCFTFQSRSLWKQIARKIPLLEELEIHYDSFSVMAIEEVGRSCPNLHYFKLKGELPWYSRGDCNKMVFAIAESMPQLRRLSLIENGLTNDGLQAILDGCPHLEYLDLRKCLRVNLNFSLLKKSSDRIIDVRLPKDAIDGRFRTRGNRVMAAYNFSSV